MRRWTGTACNVQRERGKRTGWWGQSWCVGGKNIQLVVALSPECAAILQIFFDLLVRVMSSWPRRSFMDSGRYFSTQGNCRSCMLLAVVVVVVDDEEEEEEDEDMMAARAGTKLNSGFKSGLLHDLPPSLIFCFAQYDTERKL